MDPIAEALSRHYERHGRDACTGKGCVHCTALYSGEPMRSASARMDALDDAIARACEAAVIRGMPLWQVCAVLRAVAQRYEGAEKALRRGQR